MATYRDNGDSSELPSLADDAVKLVAYSIVSVKRGAERIMNEGEGTLIVTDNMSPETFMSWILAKYLQTTVNDERDPAVKQRSQLIDPEELKYLRVHYAVTHRWPRESLEFEERQVDVLQRIRDAIT